MLQAPAWRGRYVAANSPQLAAAASQVVFRGPAGPDTSIWNPAWAGSEWAVRTRLLNLSCGFTMSLACGKASNNAYIGCASQVVESILWLDCDPGLR